MIVLTVQWLANIGEEDKVRDLFLNLAEASRKEPGCKLYLVHQHRDNRRRFFLYEQYEDDAALQAHATLRTSRPTACSTCQRSLSELRESSITSCRSCRDSEARFVAPFLFAGRRLRATP